MGVFGDASAVFGIRRTTRPSTSPALRVPPPDERTLIRRSDAGWERMRGAGDLTSCPRRSPGCLSGAFCRHRRSPTSTQRYARASGPLSADDACILGVARRPRAELS